MPSDNMVSIFTRTSSQLSVEFVALIAADKLAMSLVRIRDETGVEVNQNDKTFNIQGHWTDVVKAHDCLETTFINEISGKENNIETPSEMASEINPKRARHAAEVLMGVKTRTPRGRKPGSSINRNRFKSGLPSPVVECLQSYQLSSHTNEKDMLTAQLCLHKLNFVGNKKATAPKSAQVENDTDISSETIVDAHKDDQQVEKRGNEPLITIIKQENDTKDKDAEEEGQCSNSQQSDVKMSEDVTDENGDEDEINQETEDSDDCPEKVEPEPDDYQPNSQSESASEAEKEEVKPVRKRRPRKKTTASVEPLIAYTNVPEMNLNHDFRCDLCEYIGKRRSNLKEHKKRMHRHRFTCEHCNKKFGIRKDYRRHITSVHLDPAYSCNICDRQYKSKRAYEEHLQTHEEDYVKPNFECKICEKSFSTKYVLAGHIKSEHMGIKKSYLCPTCGRSFTQKQSYVLHANVHAGIKPFACEICGKCFTYEKSLKEHKYMHENVRRFECNVCKKTFKQSTSLRTHLKTHSDHKDYICPICGKGFSQKQSLDRHERIHSGEKPFLCTLCSKTFTDSSIIRRHMILLHKKDPKDWRNGVVSRVRPTKSFYIEGVPEHHVSRSRMCLDRGDTDGGGIDGEQEEEAGDVYDNDDGNLDDCSIQSTSEAPISDRPGAGFTKIKEEPQTVSQSHANHPHQQQQQLQNNDTLAPGVPLNYSIPSSSYNSLKPGNVAAAVAGLESQTSTPVSSGLVNMYGAAGLQLGSHPTGIAPPTSAPGNVGTQPQHWEFPAFPAYYPYPNYQQFQGPQN